MRGGQEKSTAANWANRKEKPVIVTMKNLKSIVLVIS